MTTHAEVLWRKFIESLHDLEPVEQEIFYGRMASEISAFSKQFKASRGSAWK